MNYVKFANADFLRFREYWERFDLYNQSLREFYEKKEQESESRVLSVHQENQSFLLTLESWKELYQPGEFVYVQLEGRKNDEALGSIVGVDAEKCRLEVECSNYDFINRYLNGKHKITKMKLGDVGSKVRIKRQRAALKKLYQQETANPHIRDILMGEYSWELAKASVADEELYAYLERFGENMGQAQSFRGAVEAADIFMIQGPPGTGKTTVITELVKYANQHGQSVLVSSETHIAVDNVLERVKDMEQVLPIRLGREENMSSVAKLYTPLHRMESVQKQVEEKQREYLRLEKDFDWDKFTQSVEAEWDEKLHEVEFELEQHKLQICGTAIAEEVIKKLEEFPKLLRETLKSEQEYMAAVRAEAQLRENYYELEKERNVLEAEVDVRNSELFHTGISALDDRRTKKQAGPQQRLSYLEQEQKRVSAEISGINFPRVKRVYERQRRKLEREKESVQAYLPANEKFGQWMYRVSQEIFAIRALEHKLRHWQQEKEREILRIQEDILHKRELLERSKDIRRQWLETVGNEDTRRELEDIYVKKANVVFATCTGIASNENKVFAEKQYDYCIIDEAAKCNTLDILIPICMGKKIILVGDHKQLYPVLEIDKVEDRMTGEQVEELKNNVLFRWLYEERIPKGYKSMLNVQYRMEERIARFVSQTFYHGELKNGSADNVTSVDHPSMVWMDSSGTLEEPQPDSKGYCNRQEAEIIRKLLIKLNSELPQGTTVGVITAYRRQANLLRQMCTAEKLTHLNVECSTVDAFQGKEKQIIIFNLVRSKTLTSFIKDDNRMNVAISRAQRQLYVVGSAQLVKKTDSGVIKKLYDYIKVHGLVKAGISEK